MNNEWQLQVESAGEEAAFTILYNKYKASVRQAALLYTSDPETAQEIVQEVFFRLWAGRNKLAAVQDMKQYLFIIARNCIFNHFKQSARSEARYEGLRRVTEVVVNDTDYRVRDRDYHFLLHRAVATLPPKRKTIYLLAREEGMSYEEIAATLKISKYTVKNQMVQALDGIRSYVLRHTHIGMLLLLLICWQPVTRF